MTQTFTDALPNARSIVENAIGTSTASTTDLTDSATYTKTSIVDITAGVITLDLAVPDAITDLVATPATEQIDLTWSLTADYHGSAVTAQTLYRSTTASIDITNPSSYDTTFSLAADAVSYSDTTTTIYHTYYYVITSTNGVGESNASNEESAMEDYGIGTSFNASILPVPSSWVDYGIYTTFNS